MSALCPAPEELSRALSQGATTGLVEHLASCSRCSDEWNGALRLRALVRSLPAPAPARRHVADVRARLVAEASAVRRPVRKAPLAVAALAAAAAVALAVALPRHAPRSAPDAPSARRHGVVTAAQGARYALLGAAPDEIVLLESGSIHVEVSPLRAGERFRVRAGDGEVEVRGTAFDVTVDDGHMSNVMVQHGRVEVRPAGAAGATLTGGEGWHAAARTAPAGTAPTPVHEGSAAPAADDAPDASRMLPGSAPLRRRAVASQPALPASPPLSSAAYASGPAESSAVGSREPAPAPLPAAPVSPAVNPPPKTAPAAPESAPSPAQDVRDRDDQRRDRREERRERYDQRRMR
jgi:ferric-dicitrate binding protein FerR (iron transport regulator)